MVSKSIIVLLIGLCFIKNTSAHKGIYSGTNLGFPARLFLGYHPSVIELRFMAELRGSYGTFSTKSSTSVPKTNMSGFGGDGSLGFRMGIFYFGGGYSQDKFFQRDKPSKVNNLNLEGDMTNTYAAVGFDFVHFGIMGKYYLNSEYEFSNKSSSGSMVNYKGPESSYAVKFYYRLTKYTQWSFEYMNMKYSESQSGTAEQALSESQKLTFQGFFFGYGLGF